ncbi:MAG TPA: hypothetical protein VL137_11370 [Polyangiaceae bacterium]|jgi:colicin import membrane protein|nr:hypothetical protein [Polyangiaceae bacterium]
MSDQKESSVLFSLKELMNIEEDRIKQEQADLDAKARAEREAKEAADRTAREAEERRIREEEERRRQEESRRREEQMRLEGIQQGEIEKARAEAEQRARMEAMAAQQRHEQQLASITQASGNRKLKVAVSVIGSVAVIGGIVFGVAYTQSKAASEKEKAVLAAQNAKLQEDLDRAVKQAEENELRLRDQLKNMQDGAEKKALELKLQEAQRATEAAQTAKRRGGGASAPAGESKPAAAKPCNCAPGDPLCSCQ